jgi:hypothetical protein
MAKIDKYAAFVKEQVGVQQKLAVKYEDSPFRRGQHLDSAKNFAELADFLSEIQKKGTSDTSYLYRADTPLKRLHLTYEDIKDLTEEQLRELNLTEADRQDIIVEHIIAQNGGFHSLDKIMVDLFKETKEFPKRTTIVSRLYRMVSKGMIYNVPGKKGVYSTFEMTEQEAKKLFGNVDGETEESTGAASPETATPPPTPPAPKHAFDKNKLRFSSSTSISRRI